ncbi:MAG: hypothetical protein ACOC44_12860 [Promethearchaeia archaeon]
MRRKRNVWKTRRQKLIQILKTDKEIHDLKFIMRELEYSSKKALMEDIFSINKTLQNEGKQIYVRPACCQACGYEFTQEGNKLRIPSKCPQCKSEGIAWPSLKLKEE